MPAQKSADIRTDGDTIGDRIRLAAEKVGGVDALSDRTGIKRRTLYDYVANASEPKLSVAGRIAKETAVSLYWLASGKGWMSNGTENASAAENPGLTDLEHLEDALTIVEDWLVQNKRTMTAQKKAQVVTHLYQIIAEDAAEGNNPLDLKRVHSMLRLVA